MREQIAYALIVAIVLLTSLGGFIAWRRHRREREYRRGHSDYSKFQRR